MGPRLRAETEKGLSRARGKAWASATKCLQLVPAGTWCAIEDPSHRSKEAKLNKNGNEKFDGQQQGEGEQPASEGQGRDEECASEQQGTLMAAKNNGGPRTALGKSRSQGNALRHGLCGRGILLRDESQADFDVELRGQRRYFEPKGLFEERLVFGIATNFLLRERLLRAERAAVEGIDIEDILASRSNKSVITVGHEMDLVLRYRKELDRALDHDLDALMRAQERRKRKEAIVIPDDSTPNTDDPQD